MGRLAWLVPVFWLWANTHGGALGGLATFALAVGGWTANWLLGRASPIQSKRDLALVALIWLGCVAVCFVNPYFHRLPLAEKLGRVFTAVAGGRAQSVTVDVRGKIAEYDDSVLQLAVLKGVFSDVIEEQVTYVNAPLFAEQRGLEVALTSDVESPDYRNLISVRGAMADGTEVTVSGTLFGKNQVPKLVEVNGFDMDLDASGYLLFFVYTDRPGVVGTVGAALGEAGINIAGAQVSRTTRGGEALMAVTVDSRVPAELLGDIAGRIGAREARSADLTPR